MASDEQKKFLQYFLHQPLLSAKEFGKVYSIIYERQGKKEDFDSLVKTLNEMLKPSQLAIKSRLCEDSNDEYFALINLIESEAAKHTTEFSPAEFDLFKWIMKEIISTESGSVSSIDCINQSANIPKLSKTDAQKALDKFLASHWLKEKEGEVSFTVRTLLELEPMLKKLDDEVSDCRICGKLAIKRVVCPNEACGAKVHRYCLSKLSRSRTSLKCTVCSRAWDSLVDDVHPSTSSSQTSSRTPSEASSQASSQTQEMRNGGGRRRKTRTLQQTDSESD